jgi:hypothetical protein
MRSGANPEGGSGATYAILKILGQVIGQTGTYSFDELELSCHAPYQTGRVGVDT